MIEVRFDNTLNLPSITMPMYNNPASKGGAQKTDTETEQTKMDGVLTPLIQFDKFTIHGDMIESMELECNKYPTLSLSMHDSLGIIKTLDSPSHDNFIQLQLIPAFDDAYKKINLMFYITNINIEDDMVELNARYNVPHLYDSVMKSYGQITTYELFEQVAKDYKLGFASNVLSTNDKRYIYNPNDNIIGLLNREIEFAGEMVKDNEKNTGHVYEWWIDYWNNLNLVDIYEEYKEVLPEDKMQIYIEPTAYPQPQSDAGGDACLKSLCMLTNNPAQTQTPLYIKDYVPVLNTAPVTDQNFETYNMMNLDRSSTIIQDGDVHNDIFMKYVYGGEVFGDFDYLSQRACRNMFLNKLNAQNIEVEMDGVNFGVYKGFHINLYWYDVNKVFSEEEKKANEDIKSNINLPEDIITEENKYIINRMVSGQYYIISSNFSFSSIGRTYMWNQNLRLGRYAENIEKYNKQ